MAPQSPRYSGLGNRRAQSLNQGQSGRISRREIRKVASTHGADGTFAEPRKAFHARRVKHVALRETSHAPRFPPGALRRDPAARETR